METENKKTIRPSGHSGQKDGQKRTPWVWVEKPRRCAVLICSCGNKYLKTREGQTMCVKCISKAKKI